MSARDELRRIAFWADQLTEGEAARDLKGMSERRFAAGRYVCHRGDRFDAWTGVVTGLVKLSAISRDGKAMTFAGIGPGGWFGEGTILKNEARKYNIVALRDTRLAMMNRATFVWLFDTASASCDSWCVSSTSGWASSSPPSSTTASTTRRRV